MALHERYDYSVADLSLKEMAEDPIQEFETWLELANEAGIRESNGMALATASATGAPSVRFVLLRGVDSEGFLFYSNYESRKAQELQANPQASLAFWWPTLERQIRIEGVVERASNVESDAYFASRPRGSKLGAWTSPQSQVIERREQLVDRLTETVERFKDRPVPRPEFWGGYRLRPTAIEFWQGRPSRLHDRILYARQPESGWTKVRLAP